MSYSVAVVAVRYDEPEYAETRDAIARAGHPVVWVDRQGVGSLARAYNEGFRVARQWTPAFVWFVSNPVFGDDVLPRLVEQLRGAPDFAAIQPTYESSDHLPLRPDGSGLVKEVRFVEFTAPLVRAEVFERFPLEEAMPYWGHDLDWGHRVRADGWRMGADHGCTVQHTYVRRMKPHAVTVERRRRRKATDRATDQALIDRYGNDYPRLLGWVR